MRKINNREWVPGDRLVGTWQDEDGRITYYQAEVNTIKGDWVTVLTDKNSIRRKKIVRQEGKPDSFQIRWVTYYLWDTPEMEGYLDALRIGDSEGRLSKLFEAAREAACVSVCKAQADADKKQDESKRAYIRTLKEREAAALHPVRPLKVAHVSSKTAQGRGIPSRTSIFK